MSDPNCPSPAGSFVPARGQVIFWEAQLDENAAKALGHLPFLGGVLHGALRQFIKVHEDSGLHWRLLAPPWQNESGPKARSPNGLLANGRLRFGIVCHDGDSLALIDLADRVSHDLRWLGVREARTQVLHLTARVAAEVAPENRSA